MVEIGTPAWQCTPLLEFNLANYAGQTVVGNATLNLYVMGVASYTGTQVISVCDELNNWTEAGTSWNTLPGPYGTTGSTLGTETVVYDGVANPARYVAWTIPGSVVQSWINNPSENNGLVLVSQTTAYFQDMAFSSREGACPRCSPSPRRIERIPRVPYLDRRGQCHVEPRWERCQLDRFGKRLPAMAPP